MYVCLTLLSGVNASSKFGGRSAEEGELWEGCSLPYWEHPTPPGEESGRGQFFVLWIMGCWIWSFSLSWAPSVGFGSILWQILDFRPKQCIKDTIECCH